MCKARSLQGAVVLVVAGFLLSMCSSPPSLREQLDDLPVKHLAFYDFDPSVPLVDRVGDAPAELLHLYSLEDGADLVPYRPTSAERQQINEVFAMLPVQHQEVLQQRLIGVYCVENFAGSGMGDWILGPGDELYAVLILHPRVFELVASELLTFRANSAFRMDDPDVELTVNVSDEVSGLTYILLHESTHIVDYVERHTPFVEPAMLELFGRSDRDTHFTDQLWAGYRQLDSAIDLPLYEELRFYGLGGEPSISNNDLDSIYEALAGTPFTSLYASFSWAEDFAEFVTFYYLVHGLGSRYEIRVERDGRLVQAYEPMDSPAVMVRAGLIDQALLEPPPSNLSTQNSATP